MVLLLNVYAYTCVKSILFYQPSVQKLYSFNFNSRMRKNHRFTYDNYAYMSECFVFQWSPKKLKKNQKHYRCDYKFIVVRFHAYSSKTLFSYTSESLMEIYSLSLDHLFVFISCVVYTFFTCNSWSWRGSDSVEIPFYLFLYFSILLQLVRQAILPRIHALALKTTVAAVCPIVLSLYVFLTV